MRALRESAPKVSAATHHTYEKQTPYLRLTYTYVTEPRNSATGRHFTTRSISSPPTHRMTPKRRFLPSIRTPSASKTVKRANLTEESSILYDYYASKAGKANAGPPELKGALKASSHGQQCANLIENSEQMVEIIKHVKQSRPYNARETYL